MVFIHDHYDLDKTYLQMHCEPRPVATMPAK